MRGDGRDEGFDGVRVTVRPRRDVRGGTWWLAAIVVLAIAAGGWTVSRRVGLGDAPARAAQDAVAGDAEGRRHVAGAPRGHRGSGPRPAAMSARGPAAASPEGEDPTLDLSDYVLPGEAPAMRDVIAALHARGIRTGLGAFPPPGTSPPLRGLEVPEGFVLPEGYVRHHQASDEGERIAPILMFSPDREFVVVGGRRVPVPADRVVTPDLAPPGMPLRWVRIPPPDVGGRR
ncbi:hypothetical protein [Lysobacter humi (ex Lee et al. 2017)]